MPKKNLVATKVAIAGKEIYLLKLLYGSIKLLILRLANAVKIS